MIATITNISGVDLNALDTITLGTGLAGGTVRGGARKNPLPHPFSHLVMLWGGAPVLLGFYAQDLEYKPYTGAPSPRDELNKLIQKSYITLGFGAATPRRAVDEVFFNAI